MDILIFLVLIVAVGALIYFNKSSGLDLNKDGKIDLADAQLGAEKTLSAVKSLADLDGDGKVTIADAKVAAAKAKSTVKKAASKAKTQVKAATKRRSK
jgi:hypothetical protein